MIAEIYPVKRMPRKFGVFDYEVPDSMALTRGMGVRIPFRGFELGGVVARIKDGGSRGITLKSVTAIIPGQIFSEEELQCYEQMARDTAQSVSSILFAALPRFVKKKSSESAARRALPLTIPAREAPSITLVASLLTQRREAFITVPDLRRACAILGIYLRDHPEEPVMVLFPNVRDVRIVADRLAGHQPLVVTGEESSSERFHAWTKWRGREPRLLLGTRVTALWTHVQLGAIFVMRSSHPNHKQNDHNPRFDVREISRLLSKMLHTRLLFLDVCPRVDDLITFNAINLIGSEARPRTTVVDMTVERHRGPHPCIGHTTHVRMTEILEEGRRVICVYNKKGVASRLQCEDCGHRFPCTQCRGVYAVYEQTVRCHRCGRVEPLPITCPECRGTKLKAKGFGNRIITTIIQRLFPNKSVSCIEKGSELVQADASDVLVVTRHYLENIFDPFIPPNVGLVVDLDADLALYDPSYRAVENALHDAEEWRGVAHACKADVLFQTDVCELFRTGLSDIRSALERDAETRRAYLSPPFRRRMSIDVRVDEPHERAHDLDRVLNHLRTEFPNVTVYEAKKLILSVPPDEETRLLTFFSTLEDHYIIDTQAIE